MCVAHFALEALGVNVLASFYSEICADAIWLTETLYPSSTALGPIEFITIELICSIVARFSNCTFLIVGGPPCQDVCRLGNKAGAFGSRSVFWQHFKRVFELFRTAVSDDSRVLGLMECTVMSKQDRLEYDSVFNSLPFEVCSIHWQQITRPRWWWFSRMPTFLNCKLAKSSHDPEVLAVQPQVDQIPAQTHLLPGWRPCATRMGTKVQFSCLTRHTPRLKPMNDPRGLESCDSEARARWAADSWCQSPYQYKLTNMVEGIKTGEVRRLVVDEEEQLMGFPAGYTASLIQRHSDPLVSSRARKSLLGNSWHAQVAALCLQSLLVMGSSLPPDEHNVHQPTVGVPSFVDQAVPPQSLAVYTNLQTRFAATFKRAALMCDIHGGPATADLFGATLAASALNIQTKAMGVAVSRERLLPLGLTPEVHATLAQNLPHPLSSEAPLCEDLKWACRTILKPGYPEWLQRRKTELAAMLVQLKPMEEFFQSCRSFQSSVVSPSTVSSAIELGCQAMHWPDVSLPWLPIVGVPVVGNIDETYIFRSASAVVELSLIHISEPTRPY